MKIGEIMSRPVETATRNEPAEDAFERMRRRKIHHLVVQEGRRVVGVLSSRVAENAKGSEIRKRFTVGDLMAPYSVQVPETATVRRAANLMRGLNVGCLPVVDRGARVVGIVTTSDLLALIGRGSAKPPRRTLARRAPDRYPKPPM